MLINVFAKLSFLEEKGRRIANVFLSSKNHGAIIKSSLQSLKLPIVE